MPAKPLTQTLNDAGLELVQTIASDTPYTMAAPVRSHPPRERKQRVVLEEAPLQIVETQN
jgi:hypothetical protein